MSAMIYLGGLLGWFLIWKYVNGYKLMQNNKILLIPFAACVTYLLFNMLFSYLFNCTSAAQYEESRFNFIDTRVGNTIGAAASIIVVATVVYGLTIKKLPVEFVKFMILSFVFQLAVSTPILWIPEKKISWFQYLRDFQTVGFTYGVFLCVAGIIMLLRALPAIGELNLEKEMGQTGNK